MNKILMKSLENIIIDVENKMGQNAGLTWLFLQAICFSLNGLIIKFLPKVQSFQIVYWRAIFQILFHYPVGQFYNMNYYMKDNNIQNLLYLRGFLGTCGMVSYFYACTMIPLAEAQTLMFTSPIWTGILGALILGETYSLFEFSCAIFGFMGMLLIVKPQFLFSKSLVSPYDFGRMTAICGGMFQASIFIVIRRIKGGSSVFVTNMYFQFFCLMMAPLGMMYQESKWLNLSELMMIALMAFLAYIGQLMMTRGMGLEKPGKGSVVNYIQVVLSVIYSYYVINEEVDFFSFLGSGCIMCSAIILFYKNWYLTNSIQ